MPTKRYRNTYESTVGGSILHVGDTKKSRPGVVYSRKKKPALPPGVNVARDAIRREANTLDCPHHPSGIQAEKYKTTLAIGLRFEKSSWLGEDNFLTRDTYAGMHVDNVPMHFDERLLRDCRFARVERYTKRGSTDDPFAR